MKDLRRILWGGLAVMAAVTVKVNYHWHYGQTHDVTATITYDTLSGPKPAYTHVFKMLEADNDSSSTPPAAWTVPVTFAF